MRVAPAAAYVVPVILANAAVQALLVLPDPTASLSVPFLLGSIASGLAALAAYAVMVATSVAADATAATGLLRERGARFALWTAGLLLVVLVGSLLLAGIPAYLVLAVAPYLPIAAMSGPQSPIRANLSAIARRPLAYAGRLAVSVVIGSLLYLQAALTTFFVGGMAATAITVTVWGMAAWWLTRLWFRSFERAGHLASSEA